MILLHLILLAGSSVLAMLFVAFRFGKGRRAGEIINAIVPMIVVGVLCTLVLNANGTPKAEWIIPTLAILIVGLFCRSEKLFRVVRWGMVVLSVALCVNFLNIVQSGDYTASPEGVAQRSKLRERIALRKAASVIENRFDGKAVLPEQPVAELLRSPTIGEIDTPEVAEEWHTPLTRIYKMNHVKSKIWYPGGPVSESADKLVVKR